MSIALFIDTSKVDTASAAVEIDGKRFEKTSTSRVVKSQMILPLIEDLLKEQRLTLHDLSEIRVATGPGSFTGLRVGVAVANALGYLLDVPVNGKKTLVIPTY